MRIQSSVSYMINRYGENIRITDGKTVNKAKAIIQPLMYKNKMYLNGTAMAAGDFDGGHYQMIAPAETSFGDFKRVRIEAEAKTYIIKRAEVIRADDTDLYIWAVLTPYYPQGEDDYEESRLCA